MSRKATSLILLAGLMVQASVASAGGYASPADALVKLKFNTLVAVAEKAGLVDDLSSETLVATIFAPTDAAFAKLLSDLKLTAEQLLSSEPELLRNVLAFHVVPGAAVMAKDVKSNMRLQTLFTGYSLRTSVSSRGVSILGGVPGNRAWVVTPDVKAGMTIVHVVDKVLLPAIPPFVTATPSPAPKPTPVPRPRSPMARRVSPSPAAKPAGTPGKSPCPSTQARPMYANIVAAATATPSLSILTQAVVAANLTGFLSDAKLKATIFAPTNAAFTTALAMLNMQPEELLGNTELLTAVLTYHAVPAVAKSTDLTDDMMVPTLLKGQSLTIDLSSGGVTVKAFGSTAKVVTADITAGSAVIHIIDTVLVPKL